MSRIRALFRNWVTTDDHRYDPASPTHVVLEGYTVIGLRDPGGGEFVLGVTLPQ